MAEPDYPATYWQSLAIAADRGDLFLDAGAAAACDKACNAYMAKLKEHQTKAKRLGGASGWGEFESGKQLQRIYSAKASGGTNNMVDVLQSHIDVVKEMQTVFQKFFVETAGADETNAVDIQAQGPR